MSVEVFVRTCVHENLVRWKSVIPGYPHWFVSTKEFIYWYKPRLYFPRCAPHTRATLLGYILTATGDQMSHSFICKFASYWHAQVGTRCRPSYYDWLFIFFLDAKIHGIELGASYSHRLGGIRRSDVNLDFTQNISKSTDIFVENVQVHSIYDPTRNRRKARWNISLIMYLQLEGFI